MKSFDLPNFPSHFQHESLKLINSFLELKSSAFYLVDPNMRHRGLVTHNLAKEDDKLYQSRYMELDPLNPSLHEKSGETVIHMDSIMSAKAIDQSVYYRDFLREMDYRYVADMFFRSSGKIIAVITMLRSKAQGAFLEDELRVLRKLQPFLEYALNSVYLPERIVERKSIEERYHLTPRELDVLELILSGASNKVIAKELMLGLPTVKTHLQHIYRKTQVATRTELLSRVVADLKVTN
ncbi:MAG: LuxR C-terminal-related transcriptional regulator [Xanthomonadales bacterium]|nr:LuxR C-terminal-related transcriptional regulator [Xanthomonadales bacterium]